MQDGQPGWFLQAIGQGFTILDFGSQAQPVSVGGITAQVLRVGEDIEDSERLLTKRYDAQPGTVYLIRPDQHIAARWRSFNATEVQAALARALAKG
jgi:3-(3-hydroxy-phenyl)propionate hydroxylase